MTPTYEWLYGHYAEPYLAEQESFDPTWIKKMLAELTSDKSARLDALDKIRCQQLLCAQDAFAVGVYLGLQLLSDPDFPKLWDIHQ